MTLRRVGWGGFSDEEPFYDKVTDMYVELGADGIRVFDVYKSKKEARKRYEDIREVFIKEN